MAGTWPNLDCGDMQSRVRTYLNELAPGFFLDAEIKRWLSLGLKSIAQRTGCVQRILDAHTTASTRTVAFDAYKVHFVEYVPLVGRSRMLTKITPLQTGHFPVEFGILPTYWYEFGASIGIDPMPTTEYDLRLYVSDAPKLLTINGYTNASWIKGVNFGTGLGWTGTASNATHAGATTETMDYTTAIVTATKYTIFTVSGIGTGGIITPYFGSSSPGIAVTTNGIHMQSATSSGTTFYFSGINSVTVSEVYLFKESDFSAVGDQTELSTLWQHLTVLYAAGQALYKDKRPGPAAILESIIEGELAYLKQNVVDVIPDGSNTLL
jgi:hypothetical protein